MYVLKDNIDMAGIYDFVWLGVLLPILWVSEPHQCFGGRQVVQALAQGILPNAAPSIGAPAGQREELAFRPGFEAGLAGAKRSGHRWRRLNVHGRVLESLRCLPHVVAALLGQPLAGIPATFRT